MKASKWMTLATVAVMATACGGDDNGGTGPGGRLGSFSADVTGDLETSLDGWALFGAQSDEGGEGFGLVMSEIDDKHDAGGTITIVRLNSTSLPTGEYDIKSFETAENAGDVVVLATDSEGNDLNAIFSSTGGTLHVTTSNSNSLKGTFSVDMVGTVFADPETEYAITIEGTFDAKKASNGELVRTNVLRKQIRKVAK
ncbi:MAG TPA: hypothetical protein VG817_11115 [Gemmatimonadales bacterium]|nr:hypothetical protein [Gemmatimonadales bacterium]